MRNSHSSAKPSVALIKKELRREQYAKRYRSVLKSTIYSLVTVAAVAVLIATLVMPVLQVYGDSMSPTLQNNEIVLSFKTDSFDSGQVIAFYYNNKILVKRVIAGPGDWVDIDESGNVYVNDVLLDEPYLIEKSVGDTNIELPYQVPESRVFVMGDHRSVSLDSRNSVIGCVAQEQVVGRLVWRIWPFDRIGAIA